MNPKLPDRDVEDLVGRYLREQERAEDGPRTLAGIRSKRAARPRGASRSFRTVARWSAAAAAVLLLVGFAWNFRQSTARADAVRLVQEARDALGSASGDRAYRIRFDLAPGAAQRSPVLAALANFDCRLWTRSDRFWIEGRHQGLSWACGRDPRGHVWIAGMSGVGLDFEPEDVPPPLDEVFDLFNFDLDSTLSLLSTDFDVTAPDDGPAPSSGLTLIRGTPRADRPRPRLRSVTVEIDERSKLVRQVVLSRVRNGQPLGEVSFTFDRAEGQPEVAYHLSAHLGPDSTTYGPDRRARRRRELLRFFGSLLLKGE